MTQKDTFSTSTVIVDAGQAVISSTVDEDKSTFASLSASLAEIRKLKGVIGYILRNSTSAVVDLAEDDKITPYAMFTSQMQDCCEQISENFSLGDAESMLLEGENIKVLSMKVEENKVDVFMDKNAGHSWIIKRILL